MPIGLTAWYRTRYSVGPGGTVSFLTFDGTVFTWPFVTPGLSVLRTRVSADFWWWEDSPSPRPGPALDYSPVGIQVSYSEEILGGPPAWVPTVDEGNLDNHYKATVNEPATIVQVFPTAYDGSPDLPFQWQTVATVRTESADSAAQRHFDTGRQIEQWVTVGPVNNWVPDIASSPSFACNVTVAALIGAHT